jgi:hypothetical protein
MGTECEVAVKKEGDGEGWVSYLRVGNGERYARAKRGWKRGEEGTFLPIK